MIIKDCGNTKIVELIVRIDANSAKQVEGEINVLLDNGASKIICDFSKTEYISSAGLRVLLSILKRLQKTGGKLALCALKPGVAEVFEMAGFTALFTIYGTEEEALQA